MIHYVVHHPLSGLIVQAGHCSGPTAEEIQAWPVAPNAVLIVDAPCERIQDHRVVNGAVVERATMTPSLSRATIDADGADECVIAGLPNPCMVTISGALSVPATEVTGGSLTLTATVPGDILVRVTADPTHKAWETTIHAV